MIEIYNITTLQNLEKRTDKKELNNRNYEKLIKTTKMVKGKITVKQTGARINQV